MAEHKRQHFVPKHYLRGFSSDGRSIRLCHLKSGRIVSSASIKDQCCRDYFYGKDLRIENALAHFEGGDEAVLKQVRETSNLPNDTAGRARLSQIALFLSGRTEKIVNQLRGEMSEIVTEANKMVELHRPELPSGVTPDDVRFNVADNFAPMMSIRAAVDHLCLVSDLSMKLLLAPTNHEFITSDHPAVTINQRFQGRAKFPLSGLAMKGIQIALPISSSACLFIYDSGCYRVGFRRKETFQLERHDDIAALNALQILNANTVVYFGSQRLTNDVAAIREKFFSYRRGPQPTQKFSNQRGGLVFMLIKEDVKIPMPWSFCKVKNNAPTSFGPRESEIVGLYHRWGDEQSRRKDRISFTNWVRQNYPELHHELVRP